jgi:hypothetical protein
LSKIS